VHTGCLSAAPQRFITVQTAFALSPASKYRSSSIVFLPDLAAKPRSCRSAQFITYFRVVAREFNLIDKVDDSTFAPVQKAGELSEVWRRHVVEHGVEISMIRYVQRIET
jgi:hypothetical protein